jgi:hypothetical protein
MTIVKKILALSLYILISCVAYAQDENNVQEYIEKFKQLAMTEQNEADIPASITLAQGIYETGAGKSELALQAHNHFGIKCKATWQGETFLHDDDRKQECFRKYDSDADSYKDHSAFLKGNLRYKSLFNLPLTDYAAWAEGLKRAGYATNPAYVKRLIDMVEKYNLQQYTYEALSAKEANIGTSNDSKPGEKIPNNDIVKPESTPKEGNINMGLKGFWAKKGQVLLGQALDLNIRYAKLLNMNDLEDAPLVNDMFIYTERKRKIGMNEFHIVTNDENMQLISQREAMALENLYRFNNLNVGEEPAIGEKLFLRYKTTESAPRLKNTFLQPLASINPRLEIEKTKVEPRKEIEKIAIAETPLNVKNEQLEIVVQEIEPIKQDEQFEPTKPRKQEIEIVQSETEIPKAKSKIIEEEVVVSADAEKIKDIEKAKMMERLLNSNPIDGSPKVTESLVTKIIKKEIIEPQQPIEAIKRPIEKVNENNALETKIQVATKIPEARLKEIVQVRQIMSSPTPNYNEAVSDSVKDLKRKFDKIIYAPKPAKRFDTSLVAKPILVPIIKKEEIKKENISPLKKGITNTAKKEISKPSIAKEKIKKAIEDSKVVLAKKANDSKENKKATSEKKEVLKKKETLKKELKKTPKKDTNEKKNKSSNKDITKEDKAKDKKANKDNNKKKKNKQ